MQPHFFFTIKHFMLFYASQDNFTQPLVLMVDTGYPNFFGDKRIFHIFGNHMDAKSVYKLQYLIVCLFVCPLGVIFYCRQNRISSQII